MKFKRRRPAYCWRAIVQVVGIPVITAEELERMAEVIPGSIAHESGRSNGKVFLDWRFGDGSGHIDDAINQAGKQWRAAVAVIESATSAQCVNFRVMRFKG